MKTDALKAYNSRRRKNMNELLLISLIAWREAEKREAANHLLTGVQNTDGSERILHEVRVLVDRISTEQSVHSDAGDTWAIWGALPAY
jgi:hypothetical protein